LFQGISEELLRSATEAVDEKLTVKQFACHIFVDVTPTSSAVA
jgi:hypothetical protein